MKTISLLLLFFTMITTSYTITNDDLQSLAKAGNHTKIKDELQEKTATRLLTPDGVSHALMKARNEQTLETIVLSLNNKITFFNEIITHLFKTVKHLKTLKNGLKKSPKKRHWSVDDIQNRKLRNKTRTLPPKKIRQGINNLIEQTKYALGIIIKYVYIPRKTICPRLLFFAAQADLDVTKFMLNNFAFSKKVLGEIHSKNILDQTKNFFIPTTPGNPLCL